MQSQILPSRAALVDRIALQFEYGQNLIVLLGTSGLGKSYLLETFITDKYNDFNKAFVQSSAKLTDAQLMSDLLEQSFNNPLVDHNLSLSENFYKLLNQQQPGSCLWVIDGGRHLSEEFLIELELLAKNSPITLYIMIASAAKLPVEHAVEIHLERLPLHESKQLMGWYFEKLPHDEDPVFQAFLAEANGNPSLLLAWQQDEYIADVKVKDKVSWRVHLLVLMLLIMFLIIGLLYKSDMSDWWQKHYEQGTIEVDSTAISVSQAIAPIPDTVTKEKVADIQPTAEGERKNDISAIMQSLNAGNEINEPISSDTLIKDEPVKELVQSKVNNEVDASSVQLPINEVSSWYSKQNDSNTVIQLLAVTQKQVVDDFIEQYALQLTTYTYQTQRNDKTWWVVTTGSFTSMNDAQQGMKNLPASILKNKPFYKKISKIKQEIALVDQ
ncbi:cell division protein DamX [Pseudoalteromonas sp. 13-15]|uniref:SPOR domain-containing protein n=1 Tax=Pseudoalteromonas TaxID=53246 RepID=UPI0007301128|nr:MULTISPECIES: AAA family ATPase [Pseudoalteromonas]AUL74489.1 cell division protein DamX [Pseudoalteromonas sp. 13-15]WFO19400.1 SPOR domain-containing protein [Pseudoalteromonas sp. H100]SIO04316.1 DamX protein [Pseudoalteromonas marina]